MEVKKIDKKDPCWNIKTNAQVFLNAYINNEVRTFSDNKFVDKILNKLNWCSIIKNRFKTSDKYGIVACTLLIGKIKEDPISIINSYFKRNLNGEKYEN